MSLSGLRLQRVVGVLGGMGPWATVDLFKKVLALTEVTSEQEHVPLVIWSDPAVPDRTRALIRGGPDPVPMLRRGYRSLVRAGATAIAVPCNTAHIFLPRVFSGSRKVPILSMPEVTVAALPPATAPIGLLATEGTLHAGLYQRLLSRESRPWLVPDVDSQRDLNAAIKLIKMGKTAPAAALLAGIAAQLEARGAGQLLAGCTEITLALPPTRIPVVDPAHHLALAMIHWARGDSCVPRIPTVAFESPH